MTRAGILRGRRLLLALCVVLGVSAAIALGATDELVYTGCIANGGEHGCRRAAHDSLGGVDIAVSPDGKSVYATGGRSAVNRLHRSESGELHYRGCVADTGRYGCRNPGHRSLLFPAGVAMSPDGGSLYVTGYRGSLTLFRIGEGGSLHYRGCVEDYGEHGCRESNQGMLDGATGVAASPDGRFVYVASSIFGAVSRFRVEPHGAISPAGCINSLPIVHCRHPHHDSLNGAEGITVSPDGRTVYVASSESRSVTWFKRDMRGRLHYAGCIANRGFYGCHEAEHASLLGAANVAVSPDNKSVYVTSTYASSVTWFARRNNGALRYRGCFADDGGRGCRSPHLDSLYYPWDLAVSPDGGSVYVSSAAGDAITRFDRSPTGTLRFAGCVADRGKHGCAASAHPSLEAPYGVAVSPDGGSVYTNSSRYGSGAISSFEARRTP